jgi:pSer/pThr/pTyr-binding forkhead associated (FHA) protein
VETSLRYPDISQDKHATDGEKEVAGTLKISQSLGQVPVGCLQLSVRQLSQPQQRSGRSASNMIVLR